MKEWKVIQFTWQQLEKVNLHNSYRRAASMLLISMGIAPRRWRRIDGELGIYPVTPDAINTAWAVQIKKETP